MASKETVVWACCYCTFDNNPERSTCEMCEADKPSVDLAELFETQASISWRCVKCQQENNGHCIKCKRCLATGSLVTDNKNGISTDPCEGPPRLLWHPRTDDTEAKAFASGDFVHVDSLTDVTVPIYDSSKELRIVLLGRTGEGKSSTGNTILGEPDFTSCLSSTSVTRTCQRGTCYRYGRFIQVIDTPGMYDTEMTIPDITKEVVRCVGMTAPGPHAFILVIRPDRFTEEVQNSVDHYVKTFGEGMLNYLIIVFTRKDDLDADGKSIEDYIENGSEKLKDLVALCNNRFIAINNRGTTKEKDENVERLINIIDEMVRMNKGVYTNGMYQEAEKMVRENEEKLRREHEMILQIQLDDIREDCQRQLDAKEAEYTEITHQFQIQLQELDSSDSGGAQHDVQELRKTLKDMRAQLKRDLRGIREIAGTKEEKAKHQERNYREETREEINKGSDFVQDKLLPGLKKAAEIILPILITVGLSLLKK